MSIPTDTIEIGLFIMFYIILRPKTYNFRWIIDPKFSSKYVRENLSRAGEKLQTKLQST